MTRSREPMLLCDGEDGGCGASEHDYYEQSATTVGGVRITKTEPAPGWTTGPTGGDLCPRCTANGETGDG